MTKPCSTCGGDGILNGETCPTCGGSGEVEAEGLADTAAYAASAIWDKVQDMDDKLDDIMDKCNDIFEAVTE